MSAGERRVYRMAATFSEGRVVVRHFLSKHRAQAAAKRYAEERTEEWWTPGEGMEEKRYPAATSVVLEVSEPLVFS